MWKENPSGDGGTEYGCLLLFFTVLVLAGIIAMLWLYNDLGGQ